MSNSYKYPHEKAVQPRPFEDRRYTVNTAFNVIAYALVANFPDITQEIKVQQTATAANQVSKVVLEAPSAAVTAPETSVNTKQVEENLLNLSEPAEGANETWLQQIRDDIERVY